MEHLKMSDSSAHDVGVSILFTSNSFSNDHKIIAIDIDHNIIAIDIDHNIIAIDIDHNIIAIDMGMLTLTL
ncbi:hypothetical protein M8J75_002415 [Diaphorina citri]|nr:hypothetical protein M8J75_002415 [Diaphorina citri]